MRRVLKLFKYDIKMGYMANAVKIAVFELLCIGICLIGKNAISDCEKGNMAAGIGDYVCFVFGGPKHIFSGDLSSYTIPVLWLCIPVMAAYISGYYATKDLHTYGQQVLIRSGSRVKWWLSKCVWNLITVLSLYVMGYATVVAVAVLSGAGMTMRLTPEIVTSVCNINMLNGNFFEETVILLIMPVIVSVALSMLQLTIAMITSPIIGFMFSQTIVFFSTIFEYKVLVSNYGMLSHNKITCGSDIVWQEGIIICVIVYVAAILVGMLYFSRCNILPKNNEV